MTAPEAEFRSRYQPDYTGMDVREFPFCTMKNHAGAVETYRLDLITAQEDKNEHKPVVFFIHGGGFIQPNDKRQAYISTFAKELTKAGYAVVSPDYPQFEDERQLKAAGGEPAGYAKAAEAIHNAYRYLQENAGTLGLDASRIAMIGGSAGSWGAFYAIAGYPDQYRSFINCWGAPQQLPDVSAFPPVLSIHGTEDALVPYPLEVAAQDAFEVSGVRHELITLEGCGHTPLHKMTLFLPAMLQWLKDSFTAQAVR